MVTQEIMATAMSRWARVQGRLRRPSDSRAAIAVAAALCLLGCKSKPAEPPAVIDHPLLGLGRSGHLAGEPVAVAGVRCFQQIPRNRGERARVDWHYCTTDVSMSPGEPRILPPERTDIKIGEATVTVHPIEAMRLIYQSEPQIWTLRRVDVAGATVKVLGTEFRGWPGYRIGYAETEDGRGATYGRTVFALHDPRTKEFIGALSIIVQR